MKLLLSLLLLSIPALADSLSDYQGNGVTSNQSSGLRNPLDIEHILGGSIIDPRSIRALSSGSDSVSCIQGTSPWVGNISQFGGSNVVTGTGTSGSGIPRVTVSNDSTVGLVAGSAIIGNVRIDQTTPGTTNGVQVNAALPTGTNSIGQVTANAGTNLNTSALATSANLTAGTAKVQSVDGSGNVQPSGDVLTRKIFVQPTDGSNNQGYTASSEAKVSVTQPIPAGTNIIGNVRIDQTTPGTTNGVVVNSSSLPSGASTSALQTTGNSSLSSIDSDIDVALSTRASASNQTSGSSKTQVVDASGNVYSTTNGSASGSITGSGQSVTLTLPEGTSSTSLQLSGTFSGTVAFESSADAGTTYNARVYRGTGILNMLSTSTTTFPSEWRGNSGGMTHVRVRCTAFTSGTLTVNIASSRGTGAIFLNAAIPIGGQSVGNTSTASLTTGTSFTGTYEDMSNVASIAISALTSQATTLQVQYSQDGSTLLTGATVSYAVAANTALVLTLPPNGAQYFRAVLSNASGSTSTVALETLYRAVGMDLTRLGLGDVTNLVDTTLVPINRAVLTGRSAANTYVDLKVDSAGTLTVQGPSGVAGTPTGGILTIQGTTGATAIPATTAPGSSGTPTQTSVSCATTTTTLLAASAATKFISIRNPTSATATVWVNLAGASAVAAAPSIDLSPGSEADFSASENSYLPTSQINCISGGASASTLTLLYK